ncbi:MAG: FHA domain-containing protein [Bdellovibrionales bacterium]
MILALKIHSGPLKGGVIPLRPGLTIGRQGTGIVLSDSKVSAIHARINKMEGGAWILSDNSSKNGIRAEGQRAAAVELKPGICFGIGESDFEVIEIQDPEQSDKKKAKRQRYWHEALAEFLGPHTEKFQDAPKSVAAMEPALVLEFVRGVQTSSKWVLGYAPRRIGATSAELPIWEPGAPATCFEILQTPDGILFKTEHPDTVRINGEAVDSRILRMGDTIKILETLIEVDFIP